MSRLMARVTWLNRVMEPILASMLADGAYVGGGVLFVVLIIILLLLFFRRT